MAVRRQPKLISIDEAADMLSVSPRTVFRMAEGGDLRLIDISTGERIRPTWRVDLNDVLMLIAARTAR